jgi:hypothetical protein
VTSEFTTEVYGSPNITTEVIAGGAPGLSAYQLDVAAGRFAGTEAEWAEWIHGADGAPGPTAVSVDAGNAASLGADSLIYVDGSVFATAAQGALADTAVQPGSLGDLASQDTVTVSQVEITGTPDGSKFLRDDGSWQPVAGGGGAEWGGITGMLADQADLQAALDAKVDDDDSRLSDARTPLTHTHVAADVTDFDAEVSGNSDVAANTAARHTHANASVLNATTASFTTADESKLDGIADEATANDTDANLKARGNHTGTQTASTISDFNAAAFPAGCAENKHTTKTAARNAALASNFWRYPGTAGVDDPDNWIDGDEWISA